MSSIEEFNPYGYETGYNQEDPVHKEADKISKDLDIGDYLPPYIDGYNPNSPIHQFADELSARLILGEEIVTQPFIGEDPTEAILNGIDPENKFKDIEITNTFQLEDLFRNTENFSKLIGHLPQGIYDYKLDEGKSLLKVLKTRNDEICITWDKPHGKQTMGIENFAVFIKLNNNTIEASYLETHSIRPPYPADAADIRRDNQLYLKIEFDADGNRNKYAQITVPKAEETIYAQKRLESLKMVGIEALSLTQQKAKW